MNGFARRVAAVLAAGTLNLASAGTPAQAPADGSNAAFDRLKNLAGTWTGTAGPVGGESGEVTVRYRVTAAGHAVEESLFEGTAHEMITVYYPDGDGVSLVHYCATGNHPRMTLVAGGDPGVLAFRFAEAVNFDLSETHMHDGTLYLLGSDRLRTEWISWVEGKPGPTTRFDLTRAE